MSIDDGWIARAHAVKHCPSPNFDARPCGVSLLVIHHISLPPGVFGGNAVCDFFTNRLDTTQHPFYAQIADMRVSAHCLIRRNGEIVQLVNFNDRAWHAGQSSYQGRTHCNDFAIGIELEGTGDVAYRYGQYAALQALTQALVAHYPAIGTHIVGHEHIAPDRKTDPGPSFDWARYLMPFGIPVPEKLPEKLHLESTAADGLR
ncbi:1,6-anhydro-N-acetylmuramyl-L-alanine amidase AmpD [Ostreibacterium oceani]|uniref:1,6-anhydro-N-acetylmuramyl-L-alanine amidase AmpD n=1 Tax=Ostreibacterium oceani TaxID=2654998 RepID=UPI0038B363C8